MIRLLLAAAALAAFHAAAADVPRVPVTESEQMVAKIRANGGEIWYLLGLNEGHGFAKRDNVDYYQWAVALFLEKLKQ